MNAEIQHMRNTIDTAQNESSSWISGILHKAGNELTSIFSAPGKSLGKIVKGFASLFKE
jgi:hypothetical protein